MVLGSTVVELLDFRCMNFHLQDSVQSFKSRQRLIVDVGLVDFLK